MPWGGCISSCSRRGIGRDGGCNAVTWRARRPWFGGVQVAHHVPRVTMTNRAVKPFQPILGGSGPSLHSEWLVPTKLSDTASKKSHTPVGLIGTPMPPKVIPLTTHRPKAHGIRPEDGIESAARPLHANLTPLSPFLSYPATAEFQTPARLHAISNGGTKDKTHAAPQARLAEMSRRPSRPSRPRQRPRPTVVPPPRRTRERQP